MGPVSFETLVEVDDRPAAMAVASRLRSVGVEVTALQPIGTGDEPRFRIVVRSADLAAARRVLDGG